MEDRSHTRETGRARGKLMRLEQDLRRTKGNLAGATRNRIIGGALLLLGVLALIGSLTGDSGFLAFVAAASLLAGGWVFVKAQIKRGDARRSIDTMNDDVTGARANLTELEAQSPPTD